MNNKRYMRTKLLLLMSTIFLIVSCGKKSGFTYDPSKYFTNEEETNNSDSHKDLGPMPTDSNLYDGLLNQFCKVYYEAKFEKRFKSLFVEDFSIEDDSTVFATGPLTYYKKKSGEKTEETEYKATITRIARDEYRITFEKKGEKYWDDTTQTINYKED